MVKKPRDKSSFLVDCQEVLLNVFKEGNTASDCLLHGAHFKDYCLQEFLKKMQDAIKE